MFNIHQKYKGVFLLAVALVYSLNVHGFTHIFDNDHSSDDTHCELCITNHHEDQYVFALEPNDNYFSIDEQHFFEAKKEVLENFNQSFRSHFSYGQLYNRPPPSII